jgi:hypothetical protein
MYLESSISPWDHFHWIRDGIPVLVGGCIAGYIARKRGLAWGGLIGAIHMLHVIYITWKAWQPSDVPRPPRIPFSVIIQADGLLIAIIMSTLIVLLLGMASGYLGQFLVHRVLRQRKSSDQEASSLDRQV